MREQLSKLNFLQTNRSDGTPIELFLRFCVEISVFGSLLHQPVSARESAFQIPL
jgi:hypothetical protein